MTGYPSMLAPIDHVEPVPRRIRAVLDGATVIDTNEALYVWETPYYPQYYIPARDIDPSAVFEQERVQHLRRGSAHRVDLRLGDRDVPNAGRRYTESPIPAIADHYRFDWDAFDSWYEEDEQVYVHPRSPYVRVDALRSVRPVCVELDGVVLAEASNSVMVFETGLPTRYYLDPASLNHAYLAPSSTATACPYKGRTSGYWSVRIGQTVHEDLAWRYEFPTRQLSPIAGLVAFYNEKVDIVLDGQRLERPDSRYS